MHTTFQIQPRSRPYVVLDRLRIWYFTMRLQSEWAGRIPSDFYIISLERLWKQLMNDWPHVMSLRWAITVYSINLQPLKLQQTHLFCLLFPYICFCLCRGIQSTPHWGRPPRVLQRHAHSRGLGGSGNWSRWNRDRVGAEYLSQFTPFYNCSENC